MKKSVFTYIGILAVLTCLAFVCADSNQSVTEVPVTGHCSAPQEAIQQEESIEALDYMVTTWSSPVTREEVQEYRSILDFWTDDDKAKYKHDNFSEIWVVNLKDYPDWTLDVAAIAPEYKVASPTEEFTAEQLALVADAEYSDHLRFSARFNSTKVSTGEVEEYVLVSQSVCLVPEVQADYKGGLDALASYLKMASKDHVKEVTRDQVGRGRIFFTVSAKGTITNVKLIETSNYPNVDQAMIKIVQDIPKKWKPAQDETGKKVDQEFVFTFGQAGC